MVIIQLQQIDGPITVSRCAQLIGLDPKTLYKRIKERKFHMRSILRLSQVEEDIRIDPAILGRELERHASANWPMEYWRREGDEIHGIRQGEVEYTIQITDDIADLPKAIDKLVCTKDWVTQYAISAIVSCWVTPDRKRDLVGPPVKIDQSLLGLIPA
jgi:hypothetical protein